MTEPLEILCSSPSSPRIEHSIPIETGASSPGNDNQQEICRICHCEETPDSPLISPCYCSGSMRYVHQSCLQQWIKSSCSQYCELCKFDFILERKIKPFWKWENIDMSTRERRQLYCSIAFIILTITGVVNWSRLAWSQYKPDIGLYWWIEVSITLVFFNVMVVLMCIQCRVFNKLFCKWKFFNSITYVQNAPERKRMFRLQRRPTVFSLTDLSTSNVLPRDEANFCSLNEDDLPCGQRNSNSNSHTGSNKSLNMDDAKYTPSKKSINDGSPKTILSCKKNKELVPVEDHIHPLSEIVVIFTTNDSMSSTGGESSFSPESPTKQSYEMSRQVDSKI